MIKYFSLFVLFVFASPLIYASPFGGAITAGSGMSGRAVAEEVEGASQNPALVAFSKGYHFRLTGLQASDTRGQSALRVSVLDNMPETSLPASILYSEFRNAQGFSERDFLLNFGNFVSEKTSLGFGLGYRTRPDLNLSDPTQVDRNQVYGVAGVQHYFSNDISVAGTFEAEQYGLGLSFIYQRLIRLRLDYTEAKMRDSKVFKGYVLAGGETFINRWLVLRLGAVQMPSGRTDSTWGIGFMGPRLKLNYAYAPLNFLRSNEYAHWLDLSLPVW